MIAVLLIIHLLVATGLVGVILMQHSEGGALGIGGGGPGGMMTGRSAANLLTRTTMVLGAIFIGNSILLAVVSGVDESNSSAVDQFVGDQQSELPISFDDEPSSDLPGISQDTADVVNEAVFDDQALGVSDEEGPAVDGQSEGSGEPDPDGPQ